MKKLLLISVVFISINMFGINRTILDCNYIMDIPSLLSHDEYKDIKIIKDTLGELTFYVQNSADNNYRMGLEIFHVDSVIYEIYQTIFYREKSDRQITFLNSLKNSDNLLRDDGFFVEIKMLKKMIKIKVTNYETRKKLLNK